MNASSTMVLPLPQRICRPDERIGTADRLKRCVAVSYGISTLSITKITPLD
jgi:hypothetical protein